MLKKLPVQLIICILFAFLVGDYVSLPATQFFYALSCVLKEVILLVLPFVVFSYIAVAILSLEQNAPLLLATILGLVCASIFIAVFASYGVGLVVLPFLHDGQISDLSTLKETVTPLFSLSFPCIMGSDKAMLLGLVYGLVFSFKRNETMTRIPFILRQGVTLFLKYVFIPLLPLYVFGFVLKMHYEGNLSTLFTNFGQVFILSCLLIITYLGVLYFIAGRGNLKQTFSYIRTMFPAGLTAFSTMSSAATMPVTLEATEENLKDAPYAQLVIPTTVNCHLLGDALGVPLLGMAVLHLSGFPFPVFESFFIFAAYFCLAKFSTAAVPGGGVLVLLPVLQSHMGLTPEMASLVATIYILEDSIFTGSNVMGNGAFALISHKIVQKLGLLKKTITS